MIKKGSLYAENLCMLRLAIRVFCWAENSPPTATLPHQSALGQTGTGITAKFGNNAPGEDIEGECC